MALLTDVKINFISLVAKAANKKRFALVKSGDGVYASEAEILKQDEDKRLVTCIVYEPVEIDVHGDYMTEDEITKAAHDFMINGQGADIQHDNKKADVDIVESWVAKTSTVVGGQAIKKGTWVATAKVNDDLVWAAIKKGEITGFSMGGTATKIEKQEEQMNIEEIKKALAEVIAKSATPSELAELIKRVEAIEKAEKPAETEEEKKVRMEKEKEIDDLKGTIKKMDQALKEISNPTATVENIAKANEDYATAIRKADLTTGASLVPKTLSNQIVRDMQEIAPFFNDGNKITATGTTIRVPVRKVNATSSAKGKEEGKATEKGAINITEVEISKGTIQSVIPITDELRRDAQFDVTALVREYGAEDIAEQIALNTYAGIISTTNKIEGFTKNTAFAARSIAPAKVAFTWDELAAIKSEVKPQYHKGAKWYVSKDAMLNMKTMKDLNGRPLWIESLIPGQPSTFDGHPVVLSWQMDAAFPVLFADFKKLYMYFVDYKLESEMDRKAEEGFNNEILRARLGGIVVNPAAGFMLKATATRATI
ncbi:MAG: phage major capsid protein [Fusobacteriaceae bacterium]